MLVFRVDRRSGTAVYVQLVQQVRQAVRTGRLLPGDRLPTAREVAENTGINPNTVLRAYRDLEVLGLAEPRQGSGTFVCERPAVGSVDVTGLRDDLAGWVAKARGEGLDVADMAALLHEVATEDVDDR